MPLSQGDIWLVENGMRSRGFRSVGTFRDLVPFNYC